MRVHVVSRDHTSDRIIPRLAGALVAGTGWSVGPTPDPRAEVNLAFPYLEAPDPKGWPGGTLMAAEFSHRETTVPAKAATWDRVAESCHLRLTWATMYRDILEDHGLTHLVTPPLDREKFRPAPSQMAAPTTSLIRGTRIVLGVSGWVYPGGRKGENLVAQAAQRLKRAGVEIVATGEGWPVPIRPHTWADLHEFYWNIDAYLCTSLIEGIPYPPLEALACGVPVIVPTGVGMMDDLPDVPGVAHYLAGNYQAMVAAIVEVQTDLREGIIDREQLRSLTERFTLDAWIRDHVEAVDDLVHAGDRPIDGGQIILTPSVPLTAPTLLGLPIIFTDALDRSDEAPQNLSIPMTADPPVWHGRSGVYYVAFGDPARACAERAIASLRRHMPGLACALVSDRPLDAGEDIFIAQDDSDIGARGPKTRIYDLAPADWEYVLYLDADTELVAPINTLFDILADGWDLVFCPNPTKYVLASAMRRPDNQDECDATFAEIGTDHIVQFNGGVFGFRRSPATAAFCRGWHEEWLVYGKRDQAALDRVIFRSPLRIWVLSSEFNRVDRYDAPTARTAIVHHPTTARRHVGIVRGRLDSPEAWMSIGVRKS